MLIPPKYQMTNEIVSLLSQIEANKEVIDSHDLPVEMEKNIRRKSTLKSALYSARIEGNDLTLSELTQSSTTQKKVEVNNILVALNYLYEKEKLWQSYLISAFSSGTRLIGLFITPFLIKKKKLWL